MLAIQQAPIAGPLLAPSPAASALAGISTPLGGLTVEAANSASIAVIVTARAGTLAAQSAPGTSIGGGGTRSLWVAGPLAQVNAQLATLVYTAAQAGSDALTVTIVDSLGNISAPVAVAVSILPLIARPETPAPVLTLSGGTLTLEARHLDGLTIDLHDSENGAGAASLILVNSTLGPNTRFDLAAARSTAEAPRLAVAGKAELDGTTVFENGPALVTVAQGGTLGNAGLMEFLGSSGTLHGAGSLLNQGTIALGAGAAPSIDLAITGPGLIALSAASQLELGAAVASSQTIRFDSQPATLILADPAEMHASIAGFAAGDAIRLPGIEVDAADYTQQGAGGTLTLYSGGEVSAALQLAGAYQLSDFRISVATGIGGNAGTATTLSVQPPAATGAAITAATTDVYRFFDRTSGTQFLTDDACERDLVVANRPDLVSEAVGMKALSTEAADPAATAVYRFFDVVHGTHFFTANTTEKDALLASRPDLRFEPNSTMWEDATQQTGDVPVYRLFDTVTGTHFYTESAAERANLLTTRTDFHDEGIAFFAPAS